MKTPPSLPPPPPRRRTTTRSSLLLPIHLLHVVVVVLLLVIAVVVRPASAQQQHASSGGNNNHHEGAAALAGSNGGSKFVPPKLSYTSSDYYASLRDDNVVKSVHHQTTDDEDGDGGGGGVVGTAEREKEGTTTAGRQQQKKEKEDKEEEEDDAPAPAPTWTVFQASPDAASVGPIKRRSGPLLTNFPATDGRRPRRAAEHVVLSPEERRSHLLSNGEVCHPDDPSALVARYDHLASSVETSPVALELWKYCALYATGGVYVDADAAPLVALGDVLGWGRGGEGEGEGDNVNYVATSASRDSGVSPSLLGERGGVDASISDSVDSSTSRGTGRAVGISSFVAISAPRHDVPRNMIRAILTTEPGRLASDALLLPRALMASIADDESGGGARWARLRQRCSGVLVAEPSRGGEDGRNADGGAGGGRALLRRCPESAGYCCEIQDPTSTYVFLLSRQPLVPNQVLPAVASLPVPWGATAAADGAPKSVDGEIAFMSTVREELSSPLLPSSTKDGKPFSPGTSESTPNVYEILSSQGALPNQVPNRQACMDCLREKKASDCVICAEKCGAFCEKVCKVEVREKPVKRVVSVEGPRYRKDPERIIPRIVHQVSERAEGRRGDDMPRGREDCCSPIFYHRLFFISNERDQRFIFRFVFVLPTDVVRARHARQVPQHVPAHRVVEAFRMGVPFLGRRFRRRLPFPPLPPRGEGGVRIHNPRRFQGGPLPVLRPPHHGGDILRHGRHAREQPRRRGPTRRGVHGPRGRARHPPRQAHVPLERLHRVGPRPPLPRPRHRSCRQQHT